MTKTTARKRRVTVAANSLPLCIEFVLDETGSMSGISAQTIAGFNDFLNEQRQVPGECRMSLTKFSNGELRVPYEDLDLSFVPEMTFSTFNASGGTNLCDAIGERTTHLAARLAKWTTKPRVLFVVMTDGQDNQSYRYSSASIQQIVGNQPEWTFVYLGADQNALRIGNQMGFHDGNIKSFASAEIRNTMKDLSAATTVFRAALSSTTTFF